ncbi:MAG: oxidoreductase [Candidatus Leucobacter sulfamidivorax]|nr:oxidoreductase [Candidatus Leucobacter sulfamidivorax]
MRDTSGFAPDIPTMIRRIDELRPLIAERASEGERQRRVTPEVFEALAEIGTFRASLPKRYGGYAAGVRDKMELSRAVARGDGGAGWITAIILGNNWILGQFPEQAQDDVFLADPDACCSGVIPVTGRADVVEGGYRVSGKWGYNSALGYTSWALIAAAIHDENGEFAGTAQFAVPRSQVSEEDTWFVAGLKSSDSRTVVADDVFVPAHRVLRHDAAMSGTGATENAQGFRSAFVASLSVWLIGPQLGMAEAVYDLVSEKALSKGIAYTSYETQADSTAVQLRIAKARLQIDTALKFARDIADTLDDYAERGESPDALTRTRMRAETGWITENLQAAVDSLLTVHGSGAFAEVNPIQRHWRDLEVAARHALILGDVGYEMYGRALLGRAPEEVSLLI